MRRLNEIVSGLVLMTAGSFAGVGCGAEDPAAPEQNEPVTAAASDELGWDHGRDRDAVGLSFWWDNGEVRKEDGSPRTVTIYEDFPRFFHEIDITSTITTSTDQGIQPLIDSGDMAGLDWSGIEFVETDWRPDFDGTFTRSRFYRGAAWMERPSWFTLVPLDENLRRVGPSIRAFAGFDDFQTPVDDGFIRRFVARQVTPGCPAIDDCTGATEFTVQGLVQLRNELRPNRRARRIPQRARYLELRWTADPGNPRRVAIERADYDSTPYRYGFDVSTSVSAPANGTYFVPGESIDIKVTMTDGEGNRLHPDGSLPTYLDFVNDNIDSGIRHYDGLQQLLTLYYAQKHREGLMMYSFAGPSNKLAMPQTQVGMFDFFLPQTTMATVANDGFTAISTLNPSMPAIAIPDNWGLPVSDTVTFVIPEDAEAGTYVATVKARRDWGGEALNASGVAEVQVGSAQPTQFQPTTGNCGSCHEGKADLSKLLHGLGDRRTCYSCHSSLEFEPDHALNYRIHLIHTRSERVRADVYDCSTCHLSPPSGPPLGFPGIGPF